VYTAASIASFFPSGVHQLPAPEAGVRHICVDSRRAAWQPDSLFIALTGARTDGHQFIRHAAREGIRTFLVQEGATLPELDQVNYIRVPDVLSAFHELAHRHRESFRGTLIAVTGSNGKTWVKEWLFMLLRHQANVYRSPGSYNSQVGVPLSVWEIPTDAEVAIIEAGLSMPGEMARLEQIIRPDVLVFTHLGDAHDEGFDRDKTAKLNEKLILARGARAIVFPADEAMVITAVHVLPGQRQLVSWSLTGKGDVTASAQPDGVRTKIRVTADGQEVHCTLPFAGPIPVANLMSCLATIKAIGRDWQGALRHVPELQLIDMRLKAEEAIQDCVLINDSYSLDLDSLHFALESLGKAGQTHRKTIILSDHAHSRPDIYAELAAMIKGAGVDKLICIGREVGTLVTTLPADMECQIYADTEDFLRRVSLADFQHEVILLKGARRFGFERIARRLRKRSHSAVLHVDLGALDNNLRYFYRKISPGVGKIAVVKANAYGAGSLEICRFLAYQHVDLLAVALIDEGIELREAGISHPVMVLNPDPDGMELILDYHLEPEIYNLNILDRLLDRCAYRQEAARIHIKLDAGTNRLGFGPGDIDALVARLTGQPWVRVATVFTHLSGSDESKWDAFSHEQVSRFSAMYARLTDELGYKPPRHVLSTSGILRFPEYQFEYVRLGIGLYGVGFSAHPELVPVHTLRARIIHIHPIETGESVSYSRSFITDRPRMIATVNLGYADGLPRMAGDAGYSFRLHGRKAPITGRVCMDMTMIDVTDIPEAAIGDEVNVFGQEHPIDELAWICRTIPYEILTHLHPRIRKVYEHG
jgi:alanine racemase